MWVRVLSEKISAPELLPSRFNVLFCAVFFADDIPVKLSLTTTQRPDPPGCSRKQDNSPRFCPPSSALLCSRFPVRRSTDWEPRRWLTTRCSTLASLAHPAVQWKTSLSNEGGTSLCDYRQQVEVWCDLCYRFICWFTHTGERLRGHLIIIEILPNRLHRAREGINESMFWQTSSYHSIVIVDTENTSM